MIEPIATVRDPARGLLLVYRVDGQKRYRAITPAQSAAWKRWLRRARQIT